MVGRLALNQKIEVRFLVPQLCPEVEFGGVKQDIWLPAVAGQAEPENWGSIPCPAASEDKILNLIGVYYFLTNTTGVSPWIFTLQIYTIDLISLRPACRAHCILWLMENHRANK